MMNLSIKYKNRREIQSGQEQSRDIDLFFCGGVYVYLYTFICKLCLLNLCRANKIKMLYNSN